MYFSGKYLSVRLIYNLLIPIVWFALNVVSLFNEKIRLFVSGRKQTYSILRDNIREQDKVIWIHAASLGEYEQGLPVLERIKKDYPNFKIVLTFFSPSGYEIKKDSTSADVVAYLPMDSRSNAKRFLDLVSPSLAIFIKYEIWPNQLKELKKRKIPVLLVSALFSERQIFFKSYGGFMRKSLKAFDHFFVQNENSKKLLASIDLDNVSVSGDTRFDRVSEILNRDNQLDFMDTFKKERPCFVAGSTWPEDEKILVEYINSSNEAIKFILAPHTMKAAQLDKLVQSISKPVIKYSELGSRDVSTINVLIIDTIGLLTKIYSYADIAYVGGGFATGLHNTLEPAVFGIPVIIGPEYLGFKEAEELVEKKGIFSIDTLDSFTELMSRFLNETIFLSETGQINASYIKGKQGASKQIMEHIHSIL
ncbi:3-deoxy-D-manno-octulosonic acid transferase [Flagellimonas meridianipacifica]|uniref:3-deoxy-D-manno-octulosonic acid transferase n=1 Tax=Flagellimonas meridianipacifica TaxID=1080225 RepID=A0A2T0MJA0_9FLAO|nr:glycosyltransferase N-terminal domain-containing protein [Allomuricauda pacifica]PRX57639.1 3-deoxy-D-manno-octulosonic-acid transferase [Allomuricauda pacifica]